VGAESEFDVVVVGAGVAGVCCAGELVRLGLRPLLICETKEVAYNIRPIWIKGNRAVIQSTVICPTMSGGYWLPVAKALKAKLGALTAQGPWGVAVWGDRQIRNPYQWCLSSTSMLEALEAILPTPLGEHRDGVREVLDAMLADPFEDLTKLDGQMWTDWLAAQTTNDFVTQIFHMVAAWVAVVTPDKIPLLSAYGVVALVRAFLAGDAYIPDAYPDLREGIFVPMARAIEEQGGEVWRGRKVARILTDGGQVSGVRLEDGTEVHCPIVAIATGNSRIPHFFDPLPPEVEKLGSVHGEHSMMGYYNISLLTKEVLPPEFQSFTGVLSFDPAWSQWMWPSHLRAPWGVEPGKQVLVSARYTPKQEVADMGGVDVLYERMREVEEFYFPGCQDAVEERINLEHGGMWYSQVFAEDRLDRRSESVEGLWYVGEGSRPLPSIWTEAAAGAGVLGARSIAEQLGRVPSS
jgi:hypothetical protein